MADDWVGPQKVLDLGGDRREERRALHLLGRDVGQSLDEFGNLHAGVDQGLVGLDDLVAAKPDGADLQNGVAGGVQARGLQVQGDVDLLKGGDVCIEKDHLTPVTTSHDDCHNPLPCLGSLARAETPVRPQSYSFKP